MANQPTHAPNPSIVSMSSREVAELCEKRLLLGLCPGFFFAGIWPSPVPHGLERTLKLRKSRGTLMAALERIDTRAVLAGVDIVEVVRGYLGRDGLKKDGAEWSACCPFHTEATPSFKVSPTKQIFYCFGCGAQGDAIAFVKDYERVPFRKAVEILGGTAFLDSSRPAPAPAPPPKKPRGEWTPILPVDGDAFVAKLSHSHRGQPEAVYT